MVYYKNAGRGFVIIRFMLKAMVRGNVSVHLSDHNEISVADKGILVKIHKIHKLSLPRIELLIDYSLHKNLEFPIIKAR